MFLKTPIYLLLTLASLGYLAASNLRGWSPAALILSKSQPVLGAPIRHK